MSDRDGYRRRGHEGRVVEPVEEGGRDIGRENMYMFLVFDIRPDNVGLGDISTRAQAESENNIVIQNIPDM